MSNDATYVIYNSGCCDGFSAGAVLVSYMKKDTGTDVTRDQVLSVRGNSFFKM